DSERVVADERREIARDLTLMAEEQVIAEADVAPALEDSRHFVRRFLAFDGPRQSAPGAKGGRAHESYGGRLDGRRLVPQRRLPPTESALHLRARGDAQVRRKVVDQQLR